jgi:hypothetical protein
MFLHIEQNTMPDDWSHEETNDLGYADAAQLLPGREVEQGGGSLTCSLYSARIKSFGVTSDDVLQHISPPDYA